jgi:hypothetical protein
VTPTSIASILKALLADAEEVAPDTLPECTTPVEGYDYGRAQAYRFCLKLIETVES